MSTEQSGTESEVEPWMRSYIAGALDFTTGISVRVQKAQTQKLGYTILPAIRFTTRSRTPLGMIDMVCDEYDIPTSMDQRESGTYRLQITGRDNIKALLEEIMPFIVGSTEQVDILLNHIIPGLERGDHRDKQGFINLMYYVEKFREHSSSRGSPKYTKEFFEKEWGDVNNT